MSSEEIIKLSFAIAVAARPNLRTIFIREGSLLDENNLRLIGEMAVNANLDVFVEIVGEPDSAGIIIEGGKIKKIDDKNGSDENYENI